MVYTKKFVILVRVSVFILCFARTQTSVADDTVCSCLDEKSTDFCCYLGSLEIPIKDPALKQLCLYYDGRLITVEDGAYCLKEKPDVQRLNMLLVNPAAEILYDNDENTIRNLILGEDEKYEFYELSHITSPWRDSGAINWRVKSASLPVQKIASKMRRVIPEHTIIVPLPAEFFEKSHDHTMVFGCREGSDTQKIVHLPSPRVDKNVDIDELKDALIKAELCIVNLKSSHAAPDKKCLRMDRHNVIQ